MHPEVEPAAQCRLEVPAIGACSLLELARRAAEGLGNVLARRGRQGEDDAKRFFDVRRLGLVELVGAGGEVLDHVVEVDARQGLRPTKAGPAPAGRARSMVSHRLPTANRHAALAGATLLGGAAVTTCRNSMSSKPLAKYMSLRAVWIAASTTSI